MRNFGNILTLFNATAGDIADVIRILTDRQMNFEHLEFTFFIQTSSPANTRAVAKALEVLPVTYVFYNNYISDGSGITARGIDAGQQQRIDDILTKE